MRSPGDRTVAARFLRPARALGRLSSRPLVAVPLALVLLGTNGWLGGQVLLEHLSRRLAEGASWRGRQLGIEVVGASYAHSELTPWLETSWTDLSARGRPVGREGAAGAWCRAHAARLAIVPRGLSSVRLVAEGIEMVIEPAASSEAVGVAVLIDRVQLDGVPIDLFAIRETVASLTRELLSLGRGGRTQYSIELEGRLRFRLREAPREVRLAVARGAGRSTVVLRKADLRRLALALDTRLTEAEVAIAADHPLRVPRLLRIKTRAERTARSAREDDPSVPEDAYRHVLWSFRLTRAFGAAFAEQITDAHELGETGNTSAEREMDLQNNAVGRRWALEGVLEGTIEARVRTDPAVRRRP